MKTQMKQVLIYAGTTEGRLLAEVLAKSGVRNTVSVATEYGEELMPKLAGITVEVGRKNVDEMIAFTRLGDYCAIVDATHPFATEVSANVKESAVVVGLPYLRLQRNLKLDGSSKQERWYSDAGACARALEETKGAILLTTGSKELPIFCQNEAVRQRLVVRVLPAEENIRICKEHGLMGKQILAMQGPFSQEMNEAIMRQYDIQHLVTKESGRTGGVDAKIKAAKNTDVEVWMIGNPEKELGLDFCQVLEQLTKICRVELMCEAYENDMGVEEQHRASMQIYLIGIGMGNPSMLTVRAKQILEKTDYLFGAERLIQPFEAKVKKKALYMPEYLISEIRELKPNEKITYISILYSGDTGFASGCAKMYEKLLEEGYQNVEIIPGISTISYLSAKSGIPWQNAELFSVHGKGNITEWRMELLRRVRYSTYTFLLVSGVKDVQQIGKLLEQQEMDCEMFVGYHMSYSDEEYYHILPQEAAMLTTEGLYSCIIINKHPEGLPLTRHISDDMFLRDRVPMTKAEVRTLSIAKLQLAEHAVVYDIGSGTGSIAIEIAQHSPTVKVYAIEQSKDAVELIHRNIAHFGVDNVEVIEGMAPEVLERLPEPTHVFVGGSKGKLKEILNLIKDRKNKARVVVNAVSLETIKEITEILEGFPEAELVQLNVSKSKPLGKYHLMQAENPVMICSFEL